MSNYTIDGYSTLARDVAAKVEHIELQPVESLPLPQVVEVTRYNGGISNPAGYPPIPNKGAADGLLVDSELDLVSWEE